jgi:phosphoribosylaminoimidazole-succinocarboxamide synthase
MIVKKTTPLPLECVVRGYLAGSGWKEYQESKTICGIRLPDGLVESSKLPEPIFTPATKAKEGHDENITFEQAADLIGKELAERVRDVSIQIYTRAQQIAEPKGLIIADAKFEFGLLNGELLLIDEVLTPDSSRFWLSSEYQPGRGQHSFDKQFLRDYLISIEWDKNPPAPNLPHDIIVRTSEKYVEAMRILTGKS